VGKVGSVLKPCIRRHFLMLYVYDIALAMATDFPHFEAWGKGVPETQYGSQSVKYLSASRKRKNKPFSFLFLSTIHPNLTSLSLSLFSFRLSIPNPTPREKVFSRPSKESCSSNRSTKVS
jgi:hypothetical protein